MSIHVFYQPIDVQVVWEDVFPCILGKGDVVALLPKCRDAEIATEIIAPLRRATEALARGLDYRDPKWGLCDPEEFLSNLLVPGVLAICRELWPYWPVTAIASIDLLPDGFPVLEHYAMPIALFRPLVPTFPYIEQRLSTISGCEQMGGVLLPDHVGEVRRAVLGQLRTWDQDAHETDWQQAGRRLAEALEFAEEKGLSFTEAIE